MALDLDILWGQLRDWRRDLHQHPEFGFEEKRTSAFVATKLREFGFDEVVEGIGGTGVVGTLRRGSSNRTILLRADMDALRITETLAEERPHQSRHPGLMHACGHDGHTTMLLGAARILAAEGGFDGAVRFLFQPAEEWGLGMQAMLDDGLLARFPADEAYALHNAPGLPVGHFETRPGHFKSAEDNFVITLRGRGVHAARPHQGRDALLAASATVVALQAVVSRVLDPGETAVLSCTELLTNGTRNVIAGEAKILGDCRSFRPEVSTKLEHEMRVIARGVAEAYGCEVEVTYTREFVPIINDAALTAAAADVARTCFGEAAVQDAAAPGTGSEDFARLLQQIPGCYANIGNGDSAPLHNPAYDFNDDVIPYGVGYFVELVRQRLPLASAS